ncbi:MAG: HlyC/CorC family transporter [Verrucomicrobia bacterium]|nr:HlyC/CorC family transporter [Verrucomicrobiota bacterium]
MSSIAFEVAIIFALLLANGVFSMTEIAVVSVRKSRLRRLAESGDDRARAALALAESPNRFLATVQIGITLIGVIAAAFGGATLAAKFAEPLREIAWLAPYANKVAFALVVGALTFFTLIIGELVPKRLGLGNPEGIARLLAGTMTKLSILASPIVNVLSWFTDKLLKLLSIKPEPEVTVTEDEVRLMVSEGTRAGVFLPHEPAMVEGVLALDRLPVRELMTPRAKIIWINVADSHDAVWHKIVVSGHTVFPVYEGNQRDNVVGIISIKSIYANLAAGVPPRIRDLMVPPMIVPAFVTANTLLEQFKKTGKHVALVTDEFGGISGLVSLHDIMEAIIGELPSSNERLKPAAKRRDDGSWLVDGMLDADEFERVVTGFALHEKPDRDYQTFAGFVIKQLGHVPHEGDSFQMNGYHVEVVDMDGHRVDKVLLMPVRTAGSEGTAV